MLERTTGQHVFSVLGCHCGRPGSSSNPEGLSRVCTDVTYVTDMIACVVLMPIAEWVQVTNRVMVTTSSDRKVMLCCFSK